LAQVYLKKNIDNVVPFAHVAQNTSIGSSSFTCGVEQY